MHLPLRARLIPVFLALAGTCAAQPAEGPLDLHASLAQWTRELGSGLRPDRTERELDAVGLRRWLARRTSPSLQPPPFLTGAAGLRATLEGDPERIVVRIRRAAPLRLEARYEGREGTWELGTLLVVQAERRDDELRIAVQGLRLLEADPLATTPGLGFTRALEGGPPGDAPLGEERPRDLRAARAGQVYPPRSQQAYALFERAARHLGIRDAKGWARSPGLHEILDRESDGEVGRPNYTYGARAEDRARWPEVHAELRRGKITARSSATGLGQLLLRNVDRYYPDGRAGIGDAFNEAVGMLAYIRDRYGDPDQAWAAYGKYHEGY